MEERESSTSHTYLPGTASLVQEIDKRLLVVLRDGRTLIGYLRSVDQFANLLMQHTVERIHVGKQFGDIPRGIYLIRGENVALCGEIDPELEGRQELERVSIDEILEAQRVVTEKREEKRKRREQLLRSRGMRPLDHTDYDI
ncbi:U6 snRNA-associated Sm-like protein LSm1 [Geodia barretti]|uniref:U6 snRNA-associated Sm-like protein LSm1 n=1 Tax=Geodia barretti TaxID=519541 RepID=A0AA35W829_GEOBA|nr:U6 snRNA-associated Sm-like protein LSm1 [Geodia barretti]